MPYSRFLCLRLSDERSLDLCRFDLSRDLDLDRPFLCFLCFLGDLSLFLDLDLDLLLSLDLERRLFLLSLDLDLDLDLCLLLALSSSLSLDLALGGSSSLEREWPLETGAEAEEP